MLKKGKPTEAVLNIDFALRDRDYIKSTVGHPPGDLKLIVGFMNRTFMTHGIWLTIS